MDQELAGSPGGTTAVPSRKTSRAGASDQAGNGAAIDFGPFLRQEGRPLLWDQRAHPGREDLIHRLRLELGFSSDSLPGAVLRGNRPKRRRDITAWMGSLFQRLRLAG